MPISVTYALSSVNKSSSSKRKSNDSSNSSDSSDQEDKSRQLKRPISAARPAAAALESDEQNKKLKTKNETNDLRPMPPVNKIQLKLSVSLSSGLKAAVAASSANVLVCSILIFFLNLNGKNEKTK